MKSQLAKAYINLHSIVRCLEQLCILDTKARDLIHERNAVVQFSVRNGPKGRLIFRDGICRFERGTGACDIKLYFSSAEHFNNMMDSKANPIILKGFTKLGFLKNEFVALLKRVEYYLKPTGELLQNKDYKLINTILTFYVAFHSLVEVGMYDPLGRAVMQKAKSGVFRASIANTEITTRLKLSKGHIETVSETGSLPEFLFRFANVEKANDLLCGKMDFLTAIGMGDVQMEGYVPMMQTVEHLLPLASGYLS